MAWAMWAASSPSSRPVATAPPKIATRQPWKPCWRIVPSRYPPIDLFERIAPPEDWEALAAVESLTNPRIREEIQSIAGAITRFCASSGERTC